MRRRASFGLPCRCLRGVCLLICFCAAVSVPGRDAANPGALRPVQLRCEYLENPLGIDAEKPRLSWRVESNAAGERQTAYQLLCAATPEQLSADEGDLWDSGRVASNRTLHVPYQGQRLQAAQAVFWKVRVWDSIGAASDWSAVASWTMGLLVNPDRGNNRNPNTDWAGDWIVGPYQTESLLLRKPFEVKAGLRRALIFVCGLGQYELFVNGEKFGDDLLSPGWTDYNDTCFYDTFEIGALLNEGANAIGLVLGDGMYHTEKRNRFSKFQGTFGPQRAIVQLQLEYTDGSVDKIGSDETWRAHSGPVTFNDIYGGEDYDARLEQRGWATADFDDSNWDHAVIQVRPKGTLRGVNWAALPIRVIETRPAAAIDTLSETMQVVDFGQNASYMPHITVSGPVGSTIRLTHAEVLFADGRINRGTCGGNRGPAWWQYTKRTNELETWFPQFFYAGCRYLQVDRIPAQPGGALPALEKIEGNVVHAIAQPVGEFDCSNPLLGRIRTLVRWAQRSNMVSVLTDCPHREKLGWLEQYHLNGPAFRYEFDINRVFIKSMMDMADAQLDNGLVPNIAPEYTEFDGAFRAAAEWGCSFILIPWQHYLFTGDRELLEQYYDRMARYVVYLEGAARDQILDEGLGDWYDVGPRRLSRAELTPPEVTATAFFYHDAVMMAKIAKVLNKEHDVKKYEQLAGAIRSAFRRRFVDFYPDTVAMGSQCALSLALSFGLLDENERPARFEALVADIEKNGNAITVGDVGMRFLLQALVEGGRSDLIYTIINQDEKPGYGYMLKQGATALTESWDAKHSASHNHFMLGQIIEWFYKDLVGIDCDPTSPGFENIIIKPHPVEDLTWAEATYRSIRGPIHVRWELADGEFTLKVSIPANCSASIYLPHGVERYVETVEPAGEGLRIDFLADSGRRMFARIPSGSYVFKSSLKLK